MTMRRLLSLAVMAGCGVGVVPGRVKYSGTGKCQPVTDPIDTITAKDRFGLVECDGYLLDIRFRMLQWHELAAAMGFSSRSMSSQGTVNRR